MALIVSERGSAQAVYQNIKSSRQAYEKKIRKAQAIIINSGNATHVPGARETRIDAN